DHLLAAVDEAALEYRRRIRAREDQGELQFSRDALWDFNAVLTNRIREQTYALHKLNQFVGDLNSSESLEQIAVLAAEVISSTLRQRSVHVQLGSSLADMSVCSSAGGA